MVKMEKSIILKKLISKQMVKLKHNDKIISQNFSNYTPIDFVELEEDVPSHEEVQFLHNRNLR
ncbi:hypothetical protein BpHYR1_008900, partial [Brachionus plicatilis]